MEKEDRAVDMKIYLAGNFPQLSKKESEQVMVNNIRESGYDYHRLITWFFPKYCATAISIVKEMKHEQG